ncbi:hypothetical protein X546_20980 [Brevibacillus borstelensis cifa_chp40]|nr:hypothetical protein X546_20980 [Brevibacillus borstelensis cifa_chp40]
MNTLTSFVEVPKEYRGKKPSQAEQKETQAQVVEIVRLFLVCCLLSMHRACTGRFCPGAWADPATALDPLPLLTPAC